jgi:hypothetical protein
VTSDPASITAPSHANCAITTPDAISSRLLRMNASIAKPSAPMNSGIVAAERMPGQRFTSVANASNQSATRIASAGTINAT